MLDEIQIDRFWFEAGGRSNRKKTPNIEKVRFTTKEKVLKAIQADSWISDGFYSRLQPEIARRADTIIFLDIPLLIRLMNHTSRFLYRDNRHRELSIWDEILFYNEIIKRYFTKKHKLDKYLEEYKSKVVTLKSKKEIQQYLEDLPYKN